MASTEDGPLISGWLKKQGGVLKNWSLRWFKITANSLYYYTKDDESKLLGKTLLEGAKIIEHPFNPDDPGKYVFELGEGHSEHSRLTSSHDCSYVLMAKSEQERQMWLKVLYKVIYAKKCGAVFGLQIEETMRYQGKVGDKIIPRVVKECVEFIRNNGMDCEGIFRLAGSSKTIKTLKASYQLGEPNPFGDKYIDVNSVASLLKLYLRELPDPLIPFELYVHFMTAGLKIQHGNVEEELNNLQELLKEIPPISYNLLKYLCEFLHEISVNCEKNKMTAVNLATVFGPNILRVDDENPALLMGTANLTSQTTLYFIQYYAQIFTMEYSATGHSVNVDNLLDLGDAEKSPDSPSKFFDDLHRITSTPLDDVFTSPDALSSSLPPALLKMSNENITEPVSPNSDTTAVVRRHNVIHRQKSLPNWQHRSHMNFDDNPDVNLLGDDDDDRDSKSKSVVDERSKLGPSVNDLHLQIAVLKAEIGDMRLRYEDQIKRLKKEAVDTKKNCDNKIQKVEEEYRKRMDNLVDQLEDERRATSSTVERIMALQTELHEYQLKYGPLEE